MTRTQRLHRHLSQLLDLRRSRRTSGAFPARTTRDCHRSPDPTGSPGSTTAAAQRHPRRICPPCGCGPRGTADLPGNPSHPAAAARGTGAVRTQLRTALDSHREVFWSGACGTLAPGMRLGPGTRSPPPEHGIRWTVLESHGLLHATPRPRGPFMRRSEPDPDWRASDATPEAPARSGAGTGISRGSPAIGSSTGMSPTKRIGDYVQPYSTAPRERGFTGLKFYRITGPGPAKELLRPHRRTGCRASTRGAFVEARPGSPGGRGLHDFAARHRCSLRCGAVWSLVVRRTGFSTPWFGVSPRIATAFASLPSRLLEALPDLQLVEPAASHLGGGRPLWGLAGSRQCLDGSPRSRGRTPPAALASRLTRPESVRALRTPHAPGDVELLLAQASDWPFS